MQKVNLIIRKLQRLPNRLSLLKRENERHLPRHLEAGGPNLGRVLRQAISLGTSNFSPSELCNAMVEEGILSETF